MPGFTFVIYNGQSEGNVPYNGQVGYSDLEYNVPYNGQVGYSDLEYNVPLSIISSSTATIVPLC